MSRTKTKYLLLSFLLFTIISLIYVAYAFQLPTTESKTTTLCNYYQEGTYNYTAKLSPNLIYDNKTTLTPGEGTVYLQITEYLNLTFTYSFGSTLTANTTIKYSTIGYVLTQRWTKQNFTIPQQTVTNPYNGSVQVNIPQVNTTSIYKLVSDINSEIGVSTGNYNMTITTNIILQAETAAGTINEQLSPTLTLAFIRGAPEGDIITIENLKTTDTGRITHDETTYNDWAIYQQYASYIAFSAAIVGLAAFSFLYTGTKSKPTQPAPEKLVQELAEPYEDIIVESAQEQPQLEQNTVIINTLEDLVKIADTLTKPIIHYQKPSTPENAEPTDTFYVLDNLTRYEYTVTPSKIKITQTQTPKENEED